MHPPPVADRYEVVLVDDAPDVREVVGRHLALSGHFQVVAEGATGTDALALVLAHDPALLVLDASMPGSDGLDVLVRVRQSCPRTRVVIFSGFDSPALVEAALAHGAAAFIDKATPLSDLSARLLDILEAPHHASVPPSSPGAVPSGDAPAARSEPGGTPLSDPESVLAGQVEAFRMFFDQAAIGMATLTLAGRLARVNASLAEIVGAGESELVGRHIAELAPDEDARALRDAVARVASGAEDAFELEHAVAARAERTIHTTFSAIRDRTGRPLYLFAQAEDVTARRRALLALRESEERFRLLVEGVRDYAIFMLDPHGEVTTWNAGAARMKGYRAEEIIGQHFRIFYPPAAQAARHPELELTLAVRDGRYEEEGWRVRKDGTQFWASVVISALHDQDGNLAGFGKVTRDVTERRLATEARERAAAELAEANARLRLAAEQTSQFFAVTAHELQSPVATMTGAAELLLAHGESLPPAEQREILQLLNRGGAWLRRLLDDLLLASRLETGSFEFRSERVDVASVVADVTSQLGADGIVLDIAEPCVARGDATRVTQIVANLVTNAEKYGARPIHIRATADADTVEIRVSDSGGGVPAELEPRLFERFAQGAHHGGQGTGLGLFIVRELARGQGGDAWYERDSSGTPTFAVRLPAAI